jgi:pyridinium-3,5-biscarboxylic acid mononucleotide synthase
VGTLDAADIGPLLEAVAAGRLAPAEAASRLSAGPFGDGAGWTDLGFARVDTHRALRTHDAEVVFAAGKAPAETLGIVAALRRAAPDRPALVTRADPDTLAALVAEWPAAIVDHTATTVGATTTATTVGATTDADADGATAEEGHPAPRAGRRVPSTVVVGPLPPPRGLVTIVSAGTSDLPVVAEAALTARAHGAAIHVITDVGVAGLHRVLAVRDELAAADCLVVVAGMEGALPSVVGGLVGTPVVAVPTSIGYGASFGGLSALLGMLNSCAPGVAVCNIDNGFGAGVFAARVARAAAPRPR